jgi:hypothetical protein
MRNEAATKYQIWGGPMSAKREVLLTEQQLKEALALGYRIHEDKGQKVNVLSWPDSPPAEPGA